MSDSFNKFDPPSGWFMFGTHVDQPNVQLEFWGEGEDNLPIWERPVETPENERKFWNTSWHNWPDNKPSYTSPSGSDTVKWRGTSVYRLRAAQEKIVDAHVAVRVVQYALTERLKEYKELVESLLGTKVILGNHNCDESPTKNCIYRESDTLRDSCIFCEEPSERK